jgi:hypothetical protein
MRPPARRAPAELELDHDDTWWRAVRRLAKGTGADADRLEVEHADRARARFYAGQSADEAMAAAYEDIRARLVGAELEAA